MRISWSGLLRWEKCHRMDSLIRAGADQKDVDKRNFLTGNIVDNTMRKWLDQDNPVPGTLVGMADEKFHELTTNGELIRWKGSEAADRAKVLNDAKEALTRLEPWLIENILPHAYQPEARGWAQIQVPDRSGNLVDVELFYAIDILVKRLPNGKYWIIDLKTTRNKNYIRGETMAQLPYYALVISAAFGIPLDQIEEVSFLTPLTEQMLTSMVPTEEDYRYLLQRITSYVHGVLAMDWTMRDYRDSVCQWECSVSKSCPRGKTPTPNESGRVDFSAVAKSWKVGNSDG